MTRLTLKHVSKQYGDVVAVNDVNLNCEHGEFFSLLGPSGCGKSSTLRMIAGLEEITSGEIWFDERLVNTLEPRERNIAMVFETYALYPYLSVYENIAFPLHLRGLSKDEIDKKVRWAAEFLGITDILYMNVRRLSGGQKQCIGIGRAIVRDPSVLLMDEPISHLEARIRARMREELVSLQRRLGVTTVYVTHDQVEAMTMADRIAIMNFGKLQQVGTPKEVYDCPRNEFVAGFIGEPPMNIADCELRRDDGQLLACSPSLHHVLGPEKAQKLEAYHGEPQVRLGLRPESIAVYLSPVEGGTTAVVNVLEPQGERTILSARLAGGEIFLVEVPPEFSAPLEATIYLQFREPIHIFQKQSGMNLTF
jgi:multiple sugar transport system ATP-binding protein